ncbi:unnamed protein product [Rotaria magnacalcarata]|uniref:Innexin n=1 Tax=Rotaria magnacalcarata TaxID=392030 RepID=A0A819QJK0_9BILA|nr:unnamed protein product [Rotaria magnacalcarata]CAF2087279.1 unnamed protein product [Rotaria magnacalcarata]CAF3876449.1 unnamed protein product [Rotaria magnacalcarata]CAF4026693.1 unnamed protein product [Rotaria magnacalcarata]
MSIKLFTSAQGLPWIKSLKASNDDDHADRLNHRYCVGFLLICASIATGAPFIFERITCWVPAQFVGAYTKYTNSYCWISNTYYVPSNTTIPHSKHDREQAEIGYYQWAPFIFLLCALFFYLPRMLWRSMNTRSGIDLQYLVTKSSENTIAQAIECYCEPNEQDARFISRFCRTILCTSGKRLGNYLRSIYLMVKFLYLTNSFLQLVLVHRVLGQPGWLYGIDIWYSIFIRNSVLTDSPYFPRVTLCDLRIREVGNLHRYTVQCVLPINMLNEKLFALAWFGFIYVFISNLVSFIFTLYDTIMARSRIHFIRNIYRTSVSKPLVDKNLLEKFTQEFLMQDGVFILKIIYNNGPVFLATKVVHQLFSNYEKKEQEQEQQSISIAPQLSSSDV